MTSPEARPRIRSGIRFGGGPVVAVVRQAALVEQRRVLKACASANEIVILRPANTGVAGGSPPRGEA